MSRVLLTAVFNACVLAQQPADPPLDPSKPLLQVQGVVLDKDSRQPVPGADVIVTATGAPARGVTGDAGSFQAGITPTTGPITVSVQAVGFQPGVTRVASVSAGQPSVYVEVALTRLQSISGRLVDDETREPLAGIDVDLTSIGPGMAGREASRYGDHAVTDADGRFVVPNLTAVR